MLKITKKVAQNVASKSGCSKYFDNSCGILVKNG